MDFSTSDRMKDILGRARALMDSVQSPFCRVFSEGPSFEDDATQGVLERATQPASSP